MRKSYEIFQTMYIHMILVASKRERILRCMELLLSIHGTNSKIHFTYNYKENFLRAQEKM